MVLPQPHSQGSSLGVEDVDGAAPPRHRRSEGKERGGGVPRRRKRSLGDQDAPRAGVHFSGESRFQPVVDLCYSIPLPASCLRFDCILQGVGRKCHTSRPPIPEEREVNHLHAEAGKKWKEAAEAAADRKRRRKEKHDKACKIARVEGKPRPATPESMSEEEEDASDAEADLPGED